MNIACGCGQHDEDAMREPGMENELTAPAAVTLAAVRHCANCWDPNVRLLGNVRAGDIVEALTEALTLRAQLDAVTQERDEALEQADRIEHQRQGLAYLLDREKSERAIEVGNRNSFRSALQSAEQERDALAASEAQLRDACSPVEAWAVETLGMLDRQRGLPTWDGHIVQGVNGLYLKVGHLREMVAALATPPSTALDERLAEARVQGAAVSTGLTQPEVEDIAQAVANATTCNAGDTDPADPNHEDTYLLSFNTLWGVVNCAVEEVLRSKGYIRAALGGPCQAHAFRALPAEPTRAEEARGE